MNKNKKLIFLGFLFLLVISSGSVLSCTKKNEVLQGTKNTPADDQTIVTVKQILVDDIANEINKNNFTSTLNAAELKAQFFDKDEDERTWILLKSFLNTQSKITLTGSGYITSISYKTGANIETSGQAEIIVTITKDGATATKNIILIAADKDEIETKNLLNLEKAKFSASYTSTTSFNAQALHNFLNGSSEKTWTNLMAKISTPTNNLNAEVKVLVAYKTYTDGTEAENISTKGQAQLIITLSKDDQELKREFTLIASDKDAIISGNPELIKQTAVNDIRNQMNTKSTITSTLSAAELKTQFFDKTNAGEKTWTILNGHLNNEDKVILSGNDFTALVSYKEADDNIEDGQAVIKLTITKDGKTAEKELTLVSSDKNNLVEAAKQKVVDDKMAEISVRSATSTSNAEDLNTFLKNEFLDGEGNTLEALINNHLIDGALGTITLNDGHGFTTSVAYKTQGSDIRTNDQAEITITIEKDGKSATKNIILNSSDKAALEVDDKMTEISVRSATSTSNAINLHTFLTGSSNNLETFLTHFASGVLGSITLNDGHGFTTSVAYKTNGSDIKINGQAEIIITIEKDGKSATKNIILNSSDKTALETAIANIAKQKVVNDKMTEISVRSATSTSNAINLHTFLTGSSNNLETFLTHFASGVLGSITLNDGHGFTTSVAYKTNGSDIKINGQAEIIITIEKDGKSATKNIILNSSDKTALETAIANIAKQKVVNDKMTEISVRSATSTSNAINLHTFLTGSSNNLETFLTHFASGVLGSITLNDGHGFTTSVAYKTNGSDIKINGQAEIIITIEKDGKSATKNIILNSSDKTALETAIANIAKQKVVNDKMTEISVRSATSTSNAINLHTFLTGSSNNLETFLTHFASGVLGSITLNDGHGFTTSVAYKTNGSDIKINGQAEIIITIEKDGKSATKNIILNSNDKAALETAIANIAKQKVVNDKMTEISVRSATSTSNAINLHTFLTGSSNNLETFLTHFASGVLGSITLNDGHGFNTSVAYKTNGSDIKINGQAEIIITIEKDGKSATKNIILNSNDKAALETAIANIAKQKVVNDKMTEISVRSATSTSNAINLHTFLTGSSNNLETFLTHFASGVLGSITLNDGHGFTTSVAYKTNGSDIKINGQVEIIITIEKDGKSATKNIILNSNDKTALETAIANIAKQKVVNDKMTEISVRSATSTSNAINLHTFLTGSSNNLETFLTHFASGVLGSITLNDGHGFTTSVAYKTNGSDIKINGQAEIIITIEKDGKSATKNIILNSSDKTALETAIANIAKQKVVNDKMTEISVRSATSTSNAINLHTFLTGSSNNLETFLTHFASGVLGSITLNDGHGFNTSVAYKTNGSDIKINGQAEIIITIEKDGKSATKNIILNSSDKTALETAIANIAKQKVVNDKMTEISVRSATSTSNAINLHTFLTGSSNNLETFLTHFASGVLGSITLNDGHGFNTSVAYKTNGSDIKINGQAEIIITIEKDGKSATKNIILNSSDKTALETAIANIAKQKVVNDKMTEISVRSATSTSNAINLHTFLTGSSNNLETFLTHFASGVLGSITLNDGHGFTTSVAYKTNGSDIKINGQAEIIITIEKDGKSATKNIILNSSDKTALETAIANIAKQKVVNDKMTEISVRSATSTSNAINLHTFLTGSSNNLETFLTHFASGVLGSITLNDGHGFTTSVAYKTNGSDIKINGQAEIIITIEKDGKSATKNIILNSSDKTALETAIANIAKQKVVNDKMTEISVRSATSTSNAINLHTFLTGSSNNLETFLTHFASGVLGSITLNDGHGFTTSVAYKTNGSDIKINGQAEITITIEKDGKSATKNIILNSSNKAALETAIANIAFVYLEEAKFTNTLTSKSDAATLHAFFSVSGEKTWASFKNVHITNGVNLDASVKALVKYKTSDTIEDGQTIITVTITKGDAIIEKDITLNSSNKAALETAAANITSVFLEEAKFTNTLTSKSDAATLHAFFSVSGEKTWASFKNVHITNGVNLDASVKALVKYKTSDTIEDGQTIITVTITKGDAIIEKDITLNSSDKDEIEFQTENIMPDILKSAITDESDRQIILWNTIITYDTPPNIEFSKNIDELQITNSEVETMKNNGWIIKFNGVINLLKEDGWIWLPNKARLYLTKNGKTIIKIVTIT